MQKKLHKCDIRAEASKHFACINNLLIAAGLESKHLCNIGKVEAHRVMARCCATGAAKELDRIGHDLQGPLWNVLRPGGDCDGHQLLAQNGA